jgi:hypothetical protein
MRFWRWWAGDIQAYKILDTLIVAFATRDRWVKSFPNSRFDM